MAHHPARQIGEILDRKRLRATRGVDSRRGESCLGGFGGHAGRRRPHECVSQGLAPFSEGRMNEGEQEVVADVVAVVVEVVPAAVLVEVDVVAVPPVDPDVVAPDLNVASKESSNSGELMAEEAVTELA
jgi:hypothetical protein